LQLLFTHLVNTAPRSRDIPAWIPRRLPGSLKPRPPPVIPSLYLNQARDPRTVTPAPRTVTQYARTWIMIRDPRGMVIA
jgi:hypothetical protein